MIESKFGQRLAGVLFLTLGGVFTAWIWHMALDGEPYNVMAAALFPAFAVGGLTMLLFPLDFARLRAEHGVDKPQKLAHYPPVWKALFVLALVAGLGNWLALSLL